MYVELSTRCRHVEIYTYPSRVSHLQPSAILRVSVSHLQVVWPAHSDSKYPKLLFGLRT
jgi:hypothetical protein